MKGITRKEDDMCGRMALTIPINELQDILGFPVPMEYRERYNICPGQPVLAVRRTESGGRQAEYLKWGLIPSWAKDKSIGYKMINARSETVHEKPSFRHAARYRRCLIPASGFHEWREQGGKKQPFFIHLKDGIPMYFAGLWDSWKSPEGEIESCTILTTSANSLIESLHDRMPVILAREDHSLWLDNTVTAPDQLKHLYRPYPPGLMNMYPISPLINFPRNDSTDLILPIQIDSLSV